MGQRNKGRKGKNYSVEMEEERGEEWQRRTLWQKEASEKVERCDRAVRSLRGRFG